MYHPNQIAWLVAVMLLGPACNQTGNTTTEPAAAELQASDQERLDLPVLATLPPFSLTDESGQQFGTDQLNGKTWIGNFIFTRCPSTCPVQTANLQRLQRRLKKLAGWENIQLISFTVDPNYDTPDVLADYAKRADADPEHWHFLTGSREDIWSLCKKGFKLAVADAPPEADSLIMHSPMFVLVDGQGRIRGFFNGTTKAGIADISQGLEQLLEEDETSEPPS
jgi:protein SCO1/2